MPVEKNNLTNKWNKIYSKLQLEGVLGVISIVIGTWALIEMMLGYYDPSNSAISYGVAFKLIIIAILGSAASLVIAYKNKGKKVVSFVAVAVSCILLAFNMYSKTPELVSNDTDLNPGFVSDSSKKTNTNKPIATNLEVGDWIEIEDTPGDSYRLKLASIEDDGPRYKIKMEIINTGKHHSASVSAFDFRGENADGIWETASFDGPVGGGCGYYFNVDPGKTGSISNYLTVKSNSKKLVYENKGMVRAVWNLPQL